MAKPWIRCWPPEDYAALDLSFTGDTNQDGITNGTAFAFGLDSESPAALGRTPVPWPDGAALLMSFRQRIGGAGTPGMGYEVDGIRYMVEYSRDLAGTWPETAGTAQIEGDPVDHLDGTETVSIRIPRPPGSDALFARMRIDLLPWAPAEE